jgi:hypothetical protein
MWGDLGAAIERFEPASGDPFYRKYRASPGQDHDLTCAEPLIERLDGRR